MSSALENAIIIILGGLIGFYIAHNIGRAQDKMIHYTCSVERVEGTFSASKYDLRQNPILLRSGNREVAFINHEAMTCFREVK